jgi:hypothetical protein
MHARVVLALAVVALAPHQESITLEVRTFDGQMEVSRATRLAVHRAGERGEPVVRVDVGADGPVRIPPGLYDAQVVREQSGRVTNIRWAERLIVLAYPDEKGHHLEVINFQNGYGALEVRDASGRRPDAEVMLFPPRDHAHPAALPATTAIYALFVVRAGEYDVLVKRGAQGTWHTGVDVPMDRTRLWIVPEPARPGSEP